jgi:hypothetical protein
MLHLATLRSQKAILFLASIAPSCTENPEGTGALGLLIKSCCTSVGLTVAITI